MPCLVVDLDKIAANAAVLTKLVGSSGFDVRAIAVLKGCHGDPDIARVALSAGFAGIADSKISSLSRLRRELPAAELTLLRQPGRAECDVAAEVCDRVCVSSMQALEWLARAAEGRNSEVGIVLVVECGDGRDGAELPDLLRLSRFVVGSPRLRLCGFMGNTGCRGGTRPTLSRHRAFAGIVRECEAALGMTADHVSGGNSGAIHLLSAGNLPSGINELRFGEALLLGRETRGGEIVPGCHADAFVLEAEVLEAATKTVKGRLEKRVVVALGLADIGAGGLVPEDVDQTIRLVASDHLVLADPNGRLAVGETVRFRPSYFALLGGMISSGVEKIYVVK